jgi:hypothetical protein
MFPGNARTGAWGATFSGACGRCPSRSFATSAYLLSRLFDFAMAGLLIITTLGGPGGLEDVGKSDLPCGVHFLCACMCSAGRRDSSLCLAYVLCAWTAQQLHHCMFMLPRSALQQKTHLCTHYSTAPYSYS